MDDDPCTETFTATFCNFAILEPHRQTLSTGCVAVHVSGYIFYTFYESKNEIRKF